MNPEDAPDFRLLHLKILRKKIEAGPGKRHVSGTLREELMKHEHKAEQRELQRREETQGSANRGRVGGMGIISAGKQRQVPVRSWGQRRPLLVL